MDKEGYLDLNLDPLFRNQSIKDIIYHSFNSFDIYNDIPKYLNLLVNNDDYIIVTIKGKTVKVIKEYNRFKYNETNRETKNNGIKIQIKSITLKDVEDNIKSFSYATNINVRYNYKNINDSKNKDYVDITYKDDLLTIQSNTLQYNKQKTHEFDIELNDVFKTDNLHIYSDNLLLYSVKLNQAFTNKSVNIFIRFNIPCNIDNTDLVLDKKTGILELFNKVLLSNDDHFQSIMNLLLSLKQLNNIVIKSINNLLLSDDIILTDRFYSEFYYYKNKRFLIYDKSSTMKINDLFKSNYKSDLIGIKVVKTDKLFYDTNKSIKQLDNKMINVYGKISIESFISLPIDKCNSLNTIFINTDQNTDKFIMENYKNTDGLIMKYYDNIIESNQLLLNNKIQATYYSIKNGEISIIKDKLNRQGIINSINDLLKHLNYNIEGNYDRLYLSLVYITKRLSLAQEVIVNIASMSGCYGLFYEELLSKMVDLFTGIKWTIQPMSLIYYRENTGMSKEEYINISRQIFRVYEDHCCYKHDLTLLRMFDINYYKMNPEFIIRLFKKENKLQCVRTIYAAYSSDIGTFEEIKEFYKQIDENVLTIKYDNILDNVYKSVSNLFVNNNKDNIKMKYMGPHICERITHRDSTGSNVLESIMLYMIEYKCININIKSNILIFEFNQKMDKDIRNVIKDEIYLLDPINHVDKIIIINRKEQFEIYPSNIMIKYDLPKSEKLKFYYFFKMDISAKVYKLFHDRFYISQSTTLNNTIITKLSVLIVHENITMVNDLGCKSFIVVDNIPVYELKDVDNAIIRLDKVDLNISKTVCYNDLSKEIRLIKYFNILILINKTNKPYKDFMKGINETDINIKPNFNYDFITNNKLESIFYELLNNYKSYPLMRQKIYSNKDLLPLEKKVLDLWFSNKLK